MVLDHVDCGFVCLGSFCRVSLGSEKAIVLFPQAKPRGPKDFKQQKVGLCQCFGRTEA